MKNIKKLLRMQKELLKHKCFIDNGFDEEDLDNMRFKIRIFILSEAAERERILALIGVLVEYEEWNEKIFEDIVKAYNDLFQIT